MKVTLDNNRIQRFITAFNLNEIFTETDSLPIQLHTYEAGELVLVEGNDLQGLCFQVSGLTKVSTRVGAGTKHLCCGLAPLGRLVKWVAVRINEVSLRVIGFYGLDEKK
ncbi:hypothetical protein [Paenibacillus sp. FSL H8-0034]|uniref:hypothetical protein n=1 Tax=Paenibacillus sp. FSL H8-0034 TaxID=2954671 RepID=UPI0030F53009